MSHDGFNSKKKVFFYSKMRIMVSHGIWISATWEILFLFVFTSTFHWHRHRWNHLALLITLQQLLRNHTTLGEHLVSVKPVLTKGEASEPPRCVHCLEMAKCMCIVQPSSSNLIRPCKETSCSEFGFSCQFHHREEYIKQHSSCYIHPWWIGITGLCSEKFIQRNEFQLGMFRESYFRDFNLKSCWWFRLPYLGPHGSYHLITTEGCSFPTPMPQIYMFTLDSPGVLLSCFSSAEIAIFNFTFFDFVGFS